MTAAAVAAVSTDEITIAAPPKGAMATLRRGMGEATAFRRLLPRIALLSILATAGRLVIPIAIQLTVDKGLLPDDGVHLDVVRNLVLASLVAVAVTAGAAYISNRLLFRATETSLHELRVKTFKRLHDLSMLHLQDHTKGSLVSRVTSDIDQLSVFMQWAGVIALSSIGQLLVASVLMCFYSWPLALFVFVCFGPLFVIMRFMQRRLAAAYGAVRERVGEMFAAIAESVLGATTVRAYGVADRTGDRIEGAVQRQYRAAVKAQRLTVVIFTSGEFAAALSNIVIVLGGVWLGLAGHLSPGRLVAFLFLATLFVQPVQVTTEGLTEAHNALASFGRVLAVLDTPIDLVFKPAGEDVQLPTGALPLAVRRLEFRYPGSDRAALRDVDVDIAAGARVAVVGETGSGKTTLAKLVTRLMDPTGGSIELGGIDLRDISAAELRSRVGMVPQDGYLFSGSIADNVRYGKTGLTDAEVTIAFDELELTDWLSGLPDGVDTQVGERGEALSVGERQLVAVVRAYVADPDLLVLDEATSAVDPATERRLSRALDSLSRGRTTVTIAHRLSTAERADQVLVFDQARLVQRGTHAELVNAEGPYARLHAAWAAQRRLDQGV